MAAILSKGRWVKEFMDLINGLQSFSDPQTQDLASYILVNIDSGNY